MDSIPLLDIGPLFDPRHSCRAETDRALTEAASRFGFMAVTGFPQPELASAEMRGKLLAVFNLPEAVLHAFSRNVTDPTQPFVNHGYFPVRTDCGSFFDGIQIGSDILRGQSALDNADPLRRPTPLPLETFLPGWRTAVRTYFAGMEKISDAILGALARRLGVEEALFGDAFRGGISALRLLRYPRRPVSLCESVPETKLYVRCVGDGRRMVAIEEHADYGFLTLLQQHEVPGLQVRAPGGAWLDVSPIEGALVVNFGRLLERWTAGRLRATAHRVLSPGRERFSIPFFYEPRVDAKIAPLPLADAEPFEPFLYGDFVWSTQQRFRRLFGERRKRDST
jgi:isopenicillin N synthase-like dioxygenase